MTTMTITWYETTSNYWLEASDGRTACVGDGVDIFQADIDDDSAGEYVSPGTEEFDYCMDRLCEDPETAEAYFDADEDDEEVA